MLSARANAFCDHLTYDTSSDSFTFGKGCKMKNEKKNTIVSLSLVSGYNRQILLQNV
jgi:hypothetical protein